MEPRLLPINALLALATPGDMNPSPLADAGFRIAALEVPVGLEPDKVVVDVVLSHAEEAVIVAAEGKSGANVDEPQAAKYARLDVQALVHAASVDLLGGSRPSVGVLYAVQEHNVDRIRRGLASAGVTAPILGVTRDRAQLHDAHLAHPLLRGALGPAPIELPWGVPRIIPCDYDSPVAIVLPQVKAVLVARLSRRTPEASAETIAAETLPHFLKYGRDARNRFVRTVCDCLRRLAAQHPESFEYRPNTRNHDALVRFLRTPEDNDNRGRTQAYQALRRSGHTRRRRNLEDPNQLDLLRELSEGETVGETSDDLVDEEEP